MSIQQWSEITEFSTAALRRNLRAGELTRVRRGAYVHTMAADAVGRHLQLVQATMPKLRPDSVVSHISAAVLHGLPVPEASLSRVTFTRPRLPGGGGTLTGQLHAYSATLRPEDITLLDGLVVTSLVKTCADLARVLTRHDAVVLLDAALHSLPAVDRESFRENLVVQLDADRCRRGADLGLERAALADGLSESWLESVSRLAMHDGGLPRPVLQFELRAPSGRLIARFDFAWPEYMLAGEADGRAKYGELLRPGESAVDAIMREKRRENEIFADGWALYRWGTVEATQPVAMCHQLRRLMARRGFAA